MINNKIVQVVDSTCLRCKQMWEYECRAFERPDSRAEKLNRLKGGALCLRRDGMAPYIITGGEKE